MVHVFYILVILLVVYKVFALILQKSIFKAVTRNKKRSKAAKEKGEKLKLEEMDGEFVFYSIFQLLYLSFLFIGLLSSQWIMFAGLILLSFVPKNKIWIRYIDGVFSILVLLFIVLNKYHFHIDVFSNLLNLFH